KLPRLDQVAIAPPLFCQPDPSPCQAYLVELEGGKVNIIDRHPTLIADDSAVQTDLLDVHGDQFVVTNFFQGSIGF
ncbi:hypothetical protein RZS08_15420, partial [Arthrospira platensis SPKY1]|nr:hypothetical protein [Arthrospira platensis SPKY1]